MKEQTCTRCKGQGAVRTAHSRERVVPASVKDKGATICSACDGEGFVTPPSMEADRKENARHSQIVDELVKEPKKPQSYPAWMGMEDGNG